MKSEVLLPVVIHAVGSAAARYAIDTTTTNISEPFEGFVSYSIEFSSFPDFAGENWSTMINTYPVPNLRV
jgi:hypothetical protein